VTLIVTGGAGFIGSNFILDWMRSEKEPIVNVDCLTYAGNLNSLESVAKDESYRLEIADIGDSARIKEILERFKPRGVINFAAESHVDRSILGPEAFVQTNIVGTFRLLDSVKSFWSSLPVKKQEDFRFLHVSTDEVYGTLEDLDPPFNETNAYAPNSPYSASKASSDHLVRAYHHTYGLPVLTTNCSNNYGPFQFPEKLIPLVIHNALQTKPLPIYGDGLQVRDWLYVQDHCSAIRKVLDKGLVGEVYNVGGLNEKTNLDIVHQLCDLLDSKKPLPGGANYRSLITYVTDRPGHDRRYAVDAGKLQHKLGWYPVETFDTGIEKTVDWYLANEQWVSRVVSGDYKNWISEQY
jgi:dTDP-glucose 4,6-dehydratase